MNFSIEFGYSSSFNFGPALRLAKTHPSFHQESEGKDASRSGFTRLIGLLDEDKVDRIYCPEIDRFSRNLGVTVTIIDKYMEKGIRFIFFKDNINTASPDYFSNQEFMFHIKGGNKVGEYVPLKQGLKPSSPSYRHNSD